MSKERVSPFYTDKSLKHLHQHFSANSGVLGHLRVQSSLTPLFWVDPREKTVAPSFQRREANNIANLGNLPEAGFFSPFAFYAVICGCHLPDAATCSTPTHCRSHSGLCLVSGQLSS